jgi:diacylglycerol O-acyltransferase / wax synthase
MAERLSSLDGSFLRVETENAHMHVAWTALLDPPESRPRPTLRALRRHIAGRLQLVPRFRQRLAPTPLDLAEPCWEDDPDFDLAEHVVSLSSQADRMAVDRFGVLTDAVLSQPLDRDRPLWRLHVAPRLDDGRIGLVAKMHHAMVDGRAALALALLLFDTRPEAEAGDPSGWSPRQAAGTVRRTADVVTDGAVESYRAVRAGARLAGSPVRSGARLGAPCAAPRWRWRRTCCVPRRRRSSTGGSAPSARWSATGPRSSRSGRSRTPPR